MNSKRKTWSKEEINYLKKLYCEDGLGSLEISLILERTQTSVHLKLKKLKFKHTKDQIKNIKSIRLKGENNPMYGKDSWCKGLTKETNDIVNNKSKKTAITRKKMFDEGIFNLKGKNNPMYGKDSWSKGLTTETSPILKAMGKKISVFRKQNWKNMSEEDKNKIRKHCAKISLNCRKEKTTIEIKVENFLKEININYISNYHLDWFVFDFYFPDKNLVIECQGDYWHANPNKYSSLNINETQRKNIARDKRKIKYMDKYRILYLFIWEYDINKNFEKVKMDIKSFLKTL